MQAFEGNTIENLRGMISLYPESIHILARDDAGIESPADFAGKRVYVGDVGSGTEADARNIMNAYGVSVDDLQAPVRGSSGDAVGLLRDGQIDAMFYTVGLGSAAITEAAQTAPITIPGGTYPGVDQDAQTITLQAMLAVSADLSEEDVYTFMNTVWNENLDAFYNDVQNPNLDEFFSVEGGLEGMSIPLHPDAVRFFEEQGVEVPEQLRPSAS